MKTIALTSANEAAMSVAAEQLLRTSGKIGQPINVLLGIHTALEAQAVYSGHGELWRIGHDEDTPELDSLVDRFIDSDCTHEELLFRVDAALVEMLNKRAVA
jgi:hypothetical protein